MFLRYFAVNSGLRFAPSRHLTLHRNYKTGDRSALCMPTIQNGGFEKVDIKRSGSQSSGKGPSEWFTGNVRVDPLFDAHDPAHASGASVTFEPGARTADVRNSDISAWNTGVTIHSGLFRERKAEHAES
jgi:hypothetical protein